MVQKKWNWQKEDWPDFHYDSKKIEFFGKRFIIDKLVSLLVLLNIF